MRRYATFASVAIAMAIAMLLIDDIAVVAIEFAKSILFIFLGFLFLVIETGFVMGLVRRCAVHRLR
jgi:hypothetical protein